MVDVDKRANDNDADLPAGFKMTELGPLPEEWKVVKLGEIGEVTAGGSAPQERYYFNGRHPFVRVQHLDEDGYWVRRWDLITDEAVQAYRLRFFPKGTIVLPKSGASIRLEKRAVLPVDAYIVSHLCAVIPNSKAVDQRYLFYALKVRKFSSEKVEGYPTLNLSEIRNALIPLPPLSEQRAIAHVLRTVQRAKEATERVIQATRELKKSLMRYLFTYGPVPISEAGKVPLKETGIGSVPEHWAVVGFEGSIMNRKIRVSKVKKRDYKSKGRFPIIDQGQSSVAGYWDDVKDVYHGPLPVIIFGDHTRLFKFVDMPFVCGGDGARVLHPNTDNFDPAFLFFALLNLDIPNRGYNRHFGVLREQKLPLPPLHEQQTIASILELVDSKLQAEENKKQAFVALFNTLLLNLMEGKIRLPEFAGGD